jgi:phosphoesterase RecJ-like protein
VLENPEITPKYAHLLEGLTCASVEGKIVIAVDVASPGMLPVNGKDIKPALRIDHHGSATSFAELEWVEPDTAACGEIVHDLLTELGVKMDREIANAVYTAVSTDTGCFRYANTRSHSFQVAAACAAVSDELFMINQKLFDTNTLGRLRIQGWMVENAKFLQDGKVCICAIPAQVEKDLGVTEDDMDNISGFPRSIEGVCLAATLRQKDGIVKLSVRAIPGWDAAAVCEKFGGGGHKGAAGASIQASLEDAVNQVIAAIETV